jgi:hypothetical protein
METEQRINRLKIDIANADFTIDRNREIIDSLTARIEAPESAGISRYDAETVRQTADDIVQDGSDADEDEGEDVDVEECLRRLFLEVQALPALMAILSLEDDKNRGHFSFETCRRYKYWIQAELEPHESHAVMAADDFLREFAARVGCESVMMWHNPLFFKGGDHREHCTRVDFRTRVAEFVRLIKSPVGVDRVHRVLGL